MFKMVSDIIDNVKDTKCMLISLIRMNSSLFTAFIDLKRCLEYIDRYTIL